MIFYIILFFLSTTISLFADGSNSSTSNLQRGTAHLVPTQKCPYLDIVTTKLERLIENGPTPSEDTDAYWLSQMQKLKKDKDFDMFLKEFSRNFCQKISYPYVFYFVVDYNAQDVKLKIYKALEEVYYNQRAEGKLLKFCKDKGDGQLKAVCAADLSALADSQFANKNYKRAFELYNEAEIYDNLGISQFHIAYMYQQGLGTNQDLFTSLQWYEKSLQLTTDNDLRAKILNNIGGSYKNISDYVKAFQCYQQSAMMGYSLAQYNLAIMYASGSGTLQDFKQAYAWITIALLQGFPGVPQAQEKADNIKNSLIIKLAASQPEEMSAAKILAEQYYNKYVLHLPDKKPKEKNLFEKFKNALEAFNAT